MVSTLGPVERTEDSIIKAGACLEAEIDRIKYALFWPISNPRVLEESYALDLICNGDPARAVIVLSDNVTYSSLINRAFASFLSNNLSTAILSIDWLISVDLYREQFIKAVCGELYSISQTELYDLFISTLCENINPISIYESIYDKEPLKHFLGIFTGRLVGIYSKKAALQLEKYTHQSLSSPVDSIVCAEKIFNEVYLPTEGVRALVETYDELNIILDKIVMRLLDLSIDAHNKALKRKEEGFEAEYNAIGPRCAVVMRGVVRTNLSGQVRERLDKNLDIIVNNVKDITSVAIKGPELSSHYKQEQKASKAKIIAVKPSLKDRVQGLFSKKK